MDKKDLRIVFMGTPEFAEFTLRRLVEDGYNIIGVVTMPDKPMGRHGSVLQSSPVKKYAVEQGIPVLQPEKLKDPAFIEQLTALKADLQIVVAFRMLPEIVWSMPRLGTFNLHGSLLPQYRGAAPINWAIINGDKETGVTTFFIDEKIDTGSILLQEKCPIEERETVETLHDKLMEMGSALVVKTVQGLENGTIAPRPQDASVLTEATAAAPKLNKTNCRIDWSKTAEECDALVRGLSPYPAALAAMQTGSGETVEMKIFASEISDRKSSKAMITDKAIFVPCSGNMLEITSLQPAGKKRMGAKDFINGHKNLIGDEKIRFI